jgi:hypothetical protein
MFFLSSVPACLKKWFGFVGEEGGGRRDKMRGIVENVCVLSLKTL